MISVGLLVRMKAKAGREQDVENFLREALEVVHDEERTVAWFAIRVAPDEFAIFDAFPDEEGRNAHLSGRVASQLMEQGARAPRRVAHGRAGGHPRGQASGRAGRGGITLKPN